MLSDTDSHERSVSRLLFCIDRLSIGASSLGVGGVAREVSSWVCVGLSHRKRVCELYKDSSDSLAEVVVQGVGACELRCKLLYVDLWFECVHGRCCLEDVGSRVFGFYFVPVLVIFRDVREEYVRGVEFLFCDHVD